MNPPLSTGLGRCLLVPLAHKACIHKPGNHTHLAVFKHETDPRLLAYERSRGGRRSFHGKSICIKNPASAQPFEWIHCQSFTQVLNRSINLPYLGHTNEVVY